MSQPESSEQKRLKLQRSFERADGHRIFIWIFGVTLVLTAGSAFLFKLYEFFYTATQMGSASLYSFLMPLTNYLVVAAGFFSLFLWAYFSGQFRDLEEPKYRMLEMQHEIDAGILRRRMNRTDG